MEAQLQSLLSPEEPRPAHTRGAPSSAMAHVQLQISRERRGTEGLSCMGRLSATLARGRLGAAWHWAQLGQLSVPQGPLSGCHCSQTPQLC